MTDDIKLPPLPLERAVLESGVKVYAEYTLRQYAREAIKADRQQRGGEPAAMRHCTRNHYDTFGINSWWTYCEPFDLDEDWTEAAKAKYVVQTLYTAPPYPDATLIHEGTRADALEPFAYATHHDEPMLFTTYAEAASYCDDDEDPIPLYDILRPAPKFGEEE